MQCGLEDDGYVSSSCDVTTL